jgi:hypothetical protein
MNKTGKNIMRYGIACLAVLILAYMVVFCIKMNEVLGKPSPSDEVVREIIDDGKAQALLLGWAKQILKTNSEKPIENWGTVIFDRGRKEDLVPSGYFVDHEMGSLRKSGIIYRSFSAAVVLPAEIEKLIESRVETNERIRIEVYIINNEFIMVGLNRSTIIVQVDGQGRLPDYVGTSLFGGPYVFAGLAKK